ncbi:MAG: UPF0182 family protein [Dehalococcoidia bacterium]|nr:UPF0182 family protein [Dehalococcoidia bacterium]
MSFFEDRGNLGRPTDPFRIGSDRLRSPIALRWIGIGAGLLVLYVVLNVAKSLYVNWLWFDSVGFTDVFRRVLAARIALFALGTVLSGVVIGLNIWLARRFAPKGVEESFIEDIDPQAIRRIVTMALAAVTIFVAVIFGSSLGGAWETILSWRNSIPFGLKDPAFSRDVAFYIFDLPAFHLMQGWALGLLVVSTAGSAAVYALAFSLQRFELNITREMRIHLSLLVGLILLVIAAGTYLSVFDLATRSSGLVAGAIYTDIYARLPVRYLLIALAAFAGITTIVNSFISTSYRLPVFTLGLWAAAGVVGGALYPSIIQRTAVDPNQLDRERPYIERNIDMTRRAYGLDAVEQMPFPALPAVTAAEVAANPDTINNIRLLDARPTRDTFNQLQSLRPFYVFNDVDVDRYTVNGNVQQVMISARELDVTRAQANWTRERLQLTHGYGAVIAPVNKIGEEGQPQLLTKDIPPVGTEIPITQNGARIYFGEVTKQYVLVNSNEEEFDYPVGENFAPTRYEPDRGIKLSSFVQRLVLAWDLGDANILISNRVNSSTRLLMNRQLSERIHKVAPFLTLDHDPYLVVDNGRLVWIQDAYTSASKFPYSQPSGSINYIRNSVKITIDTITGDMTFYQIDQQDPLIRTWAKIFPQLFVPIDQMPTSLREHLRYPEDLFKLQAERYLRYHITDPNVFFLGEDIWSVPTERFHQQQQAVEPYFVKTTLPGESQNEFALVLPFTPRGKQNTIAWIAGRSDGKHLGMLRAYRFPTDVLVFGPAQIEARIDQNPGISQQLTLWDQGGSQVIRGNLLMIPIGNSFLFVEPIYLQAQDSRLPELKRVVIANGNNIAMEPTFRDALDVVFGRKASTLPGATGQLTTPAAVPTPAAPAPPAAAPAPTATPAGTPAPSGSLTDLLGQAQAGADATQRELDRLRAIIDAIRKQHGGR